MNRRESVSLSAFFLDHTRLTSQGDVWANPDQDRQHMRDCVQAALPNLSTLDREILHLHLVQGLSQRKIRHLVGLTQQGVCRRIQSAAKRLEFVIGHPPIAPEALDQQLAGLVAPREAEALRWVAVERAHKTRAARRMKLSQQRTHSLYTNGVTTLLTCSQVRGFLLGGWFLHLSSQQRYLHGL